MIDVTVKTLDSQNHSFTLNDDITVRGFKEHIAESVSVPADSQRLIYCGRVLQDDKKLNDYDVNGKVIHLVQRAPPQPGQRNGNNGRQDAGWHSRSQYRHTRTQVHGNTMYLGAMSFPPDTVEGMPVSQLSSTLSSTRLVVAKRMLIQARQLINRLDDPNSAPSNQATESSQQEEQVPPEPNEETEESRESNVLSGGTRLSQAASAAIAASLSAAGLNNVTLLSGPSNENNGTAESTGTSPMPNNQSNAQQQQDSTTNIDGQTDVRGGTQVPRPPQMAQLLGSLLTVQERLRPYIERYRVLMLADPSLSPGPGPEGVEENQRIIDGVSESLHFLSHACHALSEIIVDMGQQPPRNLRCRPIIIQHSTFVQAGIPIQVEAHISLHGRNANNNNPNGEANDSGINESAQESADSQESANTNNTSSGQQQQDQNDQNDQNEQQRYQTQNPFGTVFNLPNNVEVLMEVSPEGGIDTGLNEPNQNNTNNNNNAGGVNNGGANGIFPWGAAPPPDFIRNLMQVVAGHMVQSGMTPTATTTLNSTATTTQQSTTLTGDSGNANQSQNTQARGNVGTHPTTATQTRSTSRPHVFYPHVHPLAFGTGIGHEREFDPFLPCYSHHVRRSPTGTANGTTNVQQAQTNQEAAQNRENQSESTAPSSTAGSNPADPTQASNSQTTIPNPFMNHLRQLLSDSGAQAGQTASNTASPGATLGQSLGNLIQMFTGGGVHVGLIGDGTNHPPEVNLANLFDGSSGVRVDIGVGSSTQVPRERDSFLVDLTLLLAQNLTLERLASFGMGDWSPITELRRPLREFFQHSFPSATSPADIQEQATERLLSELRPHLRNNLVAEDDTNNRSISRIDVVATIEALLRRHIQNELRLLFDDSIDDAAFSQGILTILNNLGTQLCTVLRYCLRGGQAGLEAIVMRLVTDLMEGNPSALRHLILNGFITRFRTFSLRVPQPPESEILSLLVHTEVPNPPSSGSTPVQQQSQPQPKPEPMETEVVEERVSNETLAEETEANSGTFPGHEILPPDWVPIIARDGIRQTRQHQMETIDGGGVTTFSDAYLGGMPSKRRKLIEQQKPRLLASPTPNHSAISISMERLVREGVNRAGVEEIEGAAVAVASDSGVRRAFGQAIKECLHPRRYRTPDFPDPHRFPNATNYFGEHGRSSKQ